MKHKFSVSLTLALIAVMLVASVALASEVDVAVVDVTAPIGSVILAPGESGSITINFTVTGNQEAGDATFEVYRDWTLFDGTFSGTNPQEFTVPKGAYTGGSSWTANTTGTVTVLAGQSEGTFTLAVGVFDITNASGSGGKLKAGDSSNYQVTVELPILSDTTPPTITITTPAAGAVYLLNQVVLADYSCEDEAGGSDIDYCTGPVASGNAIDTSSVGSKSFKVDAADNAGNTASLTHSYSVIYDFDGFFQPIDNGMLNVAKGGSGIPVKFSLSGDQGLNIFAAGYPKSVRISCETSFIPDEIETVTAGGSGLSYDALADQYVYVWKTEKSWSGTCRQLQVTLNDGTLHTADFKFK